MSWEDEDDDWEQADLKLDAQAPAKEEWSDEETEEERKAAATKARVEDVKGTEHKAAKERELTKLELAIIEREKRENEAAAEAKAKKKAALKAKLSSDGLSELEQELMDGGAVDDDFEWDGGRGHDEPDIDTTGLASQQKKQTSQRPGPQSDADFERLAGLINDQITRYEGRRGHVTLLKALCKECTVNMSTDDAKELAGVVSKIFNAKLQAEREKDKGKPKKGGKKGTMTQGKATGGDVGGRGGFDDYDYDEY